MTKDNKYIEKKVTDWEMDGKPALLVLHMQEGIVGSGAFTPVPHEDEIKAIKEFHIIEKQQELIKAFRDKKLPVIFVSVVPNAIGILVSWGALSRAAKEHKVIGYVDDPAIRKEMEPIPEMKREPNEHLLFHTGFSAFSNSLLDELLKSQCVRTVVITGWTAHSSVYMTCLSAVEHFYSVIIPRDATNSPERYRKAYEAVMDIMAPSVALVTTVQDVIAHL